MIKNNKFIFEQPKIINGNYNFFLRNSQLQPFNQLDTSFTGDVPDNSDVLTITAGTIPSVPIVFLGTGTPTVNITPPLFITERLSATTYKLNRTITPAYAANVFTYKALSGCIQCVMEFSSE